VACREGYLRKPCSLPLAALIRRDDQYLGELSAFTCPDCRGALWELRDGDLLRFRCHVGHAFSAESLMADQSEELENALWAALRSLEENAALARRMAARASEREHTVSVMQFEENARRVEQHAEVIRRAPSKQREGACG
jgi:two-component system chemotaxis response regulator CheB